MILPTKMKGSEKQERMAIMEAAISISLSHPNIVQTYTYSLTPVRERTSHSGFTVTPSTSGSRRSAETSRLNRASPSGMFPSVAASAFEVQIILEYCDRGTLHDALIRHAFFLPDGRVNYLAVLETAADMARGLAHLHASNILHLDLKVGRFPSFPWPTYDFLKDAGFCRP
jgi:serine/threonine protein kinase